MKFARTEILDTQALTEVNLEDILKAFVVMFAEEIMEGASLREVIDNHLEDLGELVADTIEELVPLDDFGLPIEE